MEVSKDLNCQQKANHLVLEASSINPNSSISVLEPLSFNRKISTETANMKTSSLKFVFMCLTFTIFTFIFAKWICTTWDLFMNALDYHALPEKVL